MYPDQIENGHKIVNIFGQTVECMNACLPRLGQQEYFQVIL